MQYIALDLEWNQPYSRESAVNDPVFLRGEIVQIGAAKMDEEFNITDTFKLFIKPKFYKKMHSRIKRLTRIKTSDLQNGCPFDKAMEYFREWCGEDFVFLTWGPDDCHVFCENLQVHHMETDWLPVWYDIQPIFDHQITSEGRQCSLSYAMEKVGEPPFEAHDALNDARSTARICSYLDMSAGLAEYDEIRSGMYRRQDIKTYKSCEEAKKDREVCEFICEQCGKMLQCTKWVAQKVDKSISLAECECGEKYLVRLRFRRNRDRTYRVSRTLCIADENTLQMYEQAAQAVKSRRRSRRKRSAKPQA